MRDSKVSYPKIELLHPAIRSEVINCINEAESLLPSTIAIRVVQGLRSIDEQNALYALGRTKVNPVGKSDKKPLGNIVTNAKGGSSYHNYGLSIDYCLLLDKDGNGTFETLSWDVKKDLDADKHSDWFEVIDVFLKHGYEAGADFKSFKDYPHIQKRFGFNWRDLLKRYNDGKFIEGTKYVSLEK